MDRNEQKPAICFQGFTAPLHQCKLEKLKNIKKSMLEKMLV